MAQSIVAETAAILENLPLGDQQRMLRLAQASLRGQQRYAEMKARGECPALWHMDNFILN